MDKVGCSHFRRLIVYFYALNVFLPQMFGFLFHCSVNIKEKQSKKDKNKREKWVKWDLDARIDSLREAAPLSFRSHLVCESLSGSFVLTDGERRSERERQTEREGRRGRREACWVNSPQLILFLFCQRVLRLSKPLSLDLTPAPRHGNEPPHTQTDTHTHMRAHRGRQKWDYEKKRRERERCGRGNKSKEKNQKVRKASASERERPVSERRERGRKTEVIKCWKWIIWRWRNRKTDVKKRKQW